MGFFQFSDVWGALQRGLWDSLTSPDASAGSSKFLQPHLLAISNVIVLLSFLPPLTFTEGQTFPESLKTACLMHCNTRHIIQMHSINCGSTIFAMKKCVIF